MKNSKLIKGLMLSFALIIIGSMSLCLAGCGEETATNQDQGITVVSREEGSGTRDAFVELTGVMKDQVDRTTDKAEITNSTAVVIQSIDSNENAIGYISMGFMNDEVKKLQVDGVEATTDNVKSGAYPLQRPFNIVTKGELEKLPQDFLDFVLSAEGQAIIEEEGYIAVNATNDTKSAVNSSSEDAKSVEPSVIQSTPYTTKNLEGTITIAGSTSVSPVIEVLAEEYKKLNENVKIEIQQIGSSAGIQSVIEGVCDIGISSRELKGSEKVEGIAITKIAVDGIAVIVNKNNEIDNITKEQLMKIFTGEIISWADLQQKTDEK